MSTHTTGRAHLRPVPDPHPDDPGPTEPDLHDLERGRARESTTSCPVERSHEPRTSASADPLTSATSTEAATGGGRGAGSGAPGRRLVLTPATSITLRPTRWLWTDRMPAGAVVLGPGREGIGKSLFCAWITARVTLGELDGLHHGHPRAVIYAATEDSWERTIAGRLIAAGADMTRVFRVDVHHTGPAGPGGVGSVVLPLSLPRDCDQLTDAITDHDVALLVLDPLISAVDSRINVNQEELRGALEPLAALADRTGAAVFGLAHFNKAGGTDVLSRITGSRAFAAVARAAIAFARDPNADDGSCVISQAKNNLGPLDLPSLRYRVESVPLDTPEGPSEWGRLVMLGETDVHVDDLLRQADAGGGAGEERDDRAELDAWLTNHLTTHAGAGSANEVYRAGGEHGYSRDQLKRAKKRLRITASKAGGWAWRLPNQTTHQTPDNDPDPDAALPTDETRERQGSKGAPD